MQNIDEIGIRLFARAVDKYNIVGRPAQIDDFGKPPCTVAETQSGKAPG